MPRFVAIRPQRHGRMAQFRAVAGADPRRRQQRADPARLGRPDFSARSVETESTPASRVQVCRRSQSGLSIGEHGLGGTSTCSRSDPGACDACFFTCSSLGGGAASQIRRRIRWTSDARNAKSRGRLPRRHVRRGRRGSGNKRGLSNASLDSADGGSRRERRGSAEQTATRSNSFAL